jgi:mono/diheme cytochrome c family protein
MRTTWLQRIALFSFIVALTLPPLSAAQSAADNYKAKCAMCHGADGSKSMMGAKPLNGAEVQGMSDADLTGAIVNGKGKMPAYKGKLTDAQIKDLVAYIRTLKK